MRVPCLGGGEVVWSREVVQTGSRAAVQGGGERAQEGMIVVIRLGQPITRCARFGWHAAVSWCGRGSSGMLAKATNPGRHDAVQTRGARERATGGEHVSCAATIYIP